MEKLREERRISTRPAIVLMHTQLDGFYQSLVWRGADSSARRHGVRLVALMGRALESPVEDESAHNSVFRIVDRLEATHLVVSTSTLGNFCGPEAVARWAGSLLPAVPTASLGTPLPGALQVDIPGDGIGKLVEHLAGVHGCRKIAFLAGPDANPDAARRLREYREALEGLGIAYDPSLVEGADFMSTRVPLAMERLLGRHPDIDALVAANDPMAIAACTDLFRRGIQVPRQVKVVGFDDIDEAHHQAPSLTTVRAPILQMASLAVDRILAPDAIRTATEPGTLPLLRDSCGCLGHSLCDPQAGLPLAEHLLERLLRPDLDPGRFLLDMQEALRTVLDGDHEDWARLFQEVQALLSERAPHDLALRLVPLLEESRLMLLQMAQGHHARAHFDLQTQVKILLRHAQWILLEDTVEGIAARLNETLRLWNCHGRLWLLPNLEPEPDRLVLERGFALGDSAPVALAADAPILPDMPPEGDSWIGLPLCTGSEQYGFLLVEGKLPAETFYEGVRFMVTNALRAATLLAREKRLSEELRALSLRDPMTGLLNRRGFLELGGRLESQARRDATQLGVLYADLDGLKAINDTWGHADGDMAIATLGKALAATFRESDVIARLGGDEFAVLFSGTTETMGIETRLSGRMEDLSRDLGRAWACKASLGWISWDPRSSTLEDALERADSMLYLSKRRRKQEREDVSFPLRNADRKADD
jgi:diguanylate cyclase (GGDEF)-like protein